MKPFLGAESTIRVGVETIIESDAAYNKHGVVFEDDGETAYFYARDYTRDELFVDALHIYDVANISDKHLPSKIKILWTRDYKAAALLINQRPHAVFDFEKRCGYTEDPFPDLPADSDWQHQAFHKELRHLFFDH
ncbi:DUF2251 domain-containing protein [Rubritalea tangerina]|uniref:DUF2251 domain-containing protein n=1 Tax=Rubritalea tangerina TaxID=430798 RepID=A0ABW4Z7Z7_9BACT